MNSSVVATLPAVRYTFCNEKSGNSSVLAPVHRRCGIHEDTPMLTKTELTKAIGINANGSVYQEWHGIAPLLLFGLGFAMTDHHQSWLVIGPLLGYLIFDQISETFDSLVDRFQRQLADANISIQFLGFLSVVVSVVTLAAAVAAFTSSLQAVIAVAFTPMAWIIVLSITSELNKRMQDV